METPISTTGTVTALLGPRAYRVRLRNGKESLGHLSERVPRPSPAIQLGDEVSLELTPYDFDHVRIVGVIRAV